MECDIIIDSTKSQDPSAVDGSESVVIGNMLHDLFDTALQDVAQPVNGIDFHILVVAQTIQKRSVDVMVGIQVVLRNALLLHGYP
jgi:hypothetical protein